MDSETSRPWLFSHPGASKPDIEASHMKKLRKPNPHNATAKASVPHLELVVIDDDPPWKHNGNAPSRGPNGYDAGSTKDSLFGNSGDRPVPAGLRELARQSGAGGGGQKKEDAGDGAGGGAGRGGGGDDGGDDTATSTRRRDQKMPVQPVSSSADTLVNSGPIHWQAEARSNIARGLYDEALSCQEKLLDSILSVPQRTQTMKDLVGAWRSMDLDGMAQRLQHFYIKHRLAFSDGDGTLRIVIGMAKTWRDLGQEHRALAIRQKFAAEIKQRGNEPPQSLGALPAQTMLENGTVLLNTRRLGTAAMQLAGGWLTADEYAEAVLIQITYLKAMNPKARYGVWIDLVEDWSQRYRWKEALELQIAYLELLPTQDERRDMLYRLCSDWQKLGRWEDARKLQAWYLEMTPDDEARDADTNSFVAELIRHGKHEDAGRLQVVHLGMLSNPHSRLHAMQAFVTKWMKLGQFREAGRIQFAYLKGIADSTQRMAAGKDILVSWVLQGRVKEAQKFQTNLFRLFQNDEEKSKAMQEMIATWRQLGCEDQAKRLEADSVSAISI